MLENDSNLNLYIYILNQGSIIKKNPRSHEYSQVPSIIYDDCCLKKL